MWRGAQQAIVVARMDRRFLDDLVGVPAKGLAVKFFVRLRDQHLTMLIVVATISGNSTSPVGMFGGTEMKPLLSERRR
jgi:hypothetical protein